MPLPWRATFCGQAAPGGRAEDGGRGREQDPDLEGEYVERGWEVDLGARHPLGYSRPCFHHLLPVDLGDQAN